MAGKDFTWNDKGSAIVALTTFIASFLFFFYYSAMLLSSLTAALLASGCIWIAYVILRWFLLASYK